VRERPLRELGLEGLAPFVRATGPLAVVDVETTGLSEDPAAELLEFGALLLEPGSQAVRILDSLVRPRGSVPRAVQNLTGIRDADVVAAPAASDVAGPIAAALAGRTLVGHNVEFDRHFLARFATPSLRDAALLDTQDLLAIAHPDAPDLRLATFVRELVGRTERHRALDDALDTARVLAEIGTRAREGAARYATARGALEAYDGDSPWLSLLGGDLPVAAGAGDAPQFIEIPPTHEKRVPFDADAIAAALADADRGARHFPGYRVREQQIRMAREFTRVLDEGGRLLLEGGTGVGKSLAYLAAAIPFAAERAAAGLREPVVVSTRTKLLQDQLLGKDIPAAAALLGYPDLRALSIKGRANYVCTRRTEQVLAEGRQPGIFERDRLAYAALATCARLRPHGEIGTLPAGLLMRFPPLRDLRRRAVAARAEHCTREQCASERHCPFGRRRVALAGAHLVVANHDLLLRWPPDYPRFTHVVADEAHELASVADEVYAAEVRPEGVLERIDELFGRTDRRGVRRRGLVEIHEGEARAWRSDVQQDLAALGGLLAERASEFGEVQLPPGASRILPQAARLAELAASRLDGVAAAAEDANDGDDEASRELVERSVFDLRGAAEGLRSAFGDESGDAVAAFEALEAPFDRWRLAIRLVSPAEAFHESFLGKLESIACVSASLFVAGDPFAALGSLEIESRTGSPVWRVAVESPFPYAEHMRVVALAGEGDLVERTADVLTHLARRLSGRSLGLFTSLRRMRDVHERLAESLREDGFDLLMPRRATDDPAALVQRFQRSAGGGVLLGARTFWQGLDIPGNALQAVVIEKLPFEVPTELRRRREARIRSEGGDAFERYTLGVMLLNLKQMLGRLIRSEGDRGIAVIVDPRIDRPYFERLAEALPPGCRLQVATLEELPELLGEVGVGTPERG
jgi:ATP-dependent DNA helicase DinG